MPTIPDTFCPLKWDEITLNSQVNYVYACCKATPIKFTNIDNARNILKDQQLNLLQGVRDPSCDYCWATESVGNTSRRLDALQIFNTSNFESYQTGNRQPSKLEINLGNECNLQCTYCNPKFSSKWAHDVNTKIYPVFADRFHYAVDPKSKTTEMNLRLLEHYEPDTLCLIGGEPLLNKQLWEILKLSSASHIIITSNFKCTNATIDKLFAHIRKFKKVSLTVSLDSTTDNAEFTRFGIDYVNLINTITYALHNAPPNVTFEIASLMSSITIRDIENLVPVVLEFKKLHSRLIWGFSYVVNPKIQSFATLPEQLKPAITSTLEMIDTLGFAEGNKQILTVMNSVTFNHTLYKELERFVIEFSERHNIATPLHLYNIL
jgi:organic radical activating enzyme